MRGRGSDSSNVTGRKECLERRLEMIRLCGAALCAGSRPRMSAETEECAGFGDNAEAEAENQGMEEVQFRSGVSDKISTLGRGIKLPGMGTANPRPLSEVLNGRGGGAGDVEYEEDWEERQSRMEESRTSTPQEKLAKMLQASQVSRGIPMPDKNAIGLAAVMGGLKQTPHVEMAAPYVGETAPGKKKPVPRPSGDNATAMAAVGAAAAAAVRKGETGSASPPVAPRKKKHQPGLRVVGAGSGGVEEMAAFMDESTVQWGLLRFTIGSGTFKRNKAILVHFNGEKASGVVKAKLNRNTPEVAKLFGDTAAKLTMEEAVEVTLDNVLKLTSKLFTADSHMDISIADIKSDYEQMLTESRRHEIEAMISGDSETAKRRTAKEMGIATDEALNLVHKPLGPFNWALFSIDGTAIDLWDAGSLGVTEMGSLLPKDQILCGVVRMGFGTGKFRRTKWISLWWSGADVGAHKKGSVLGTAKEKAMAKMKAPISMEGETPDDFSLEAIIDKVRRSAVIDGDGIDEKGNSWEGGPDAVFSLDAYYAALEEEVKQNAGFFGETTSDGRSFGMAHTVKEVRSENGKYNWMLVQAD